MLYTYDPIKLFFQSSNVCFINEVESQLHLIISLLVLVSYYIGQLIFSKEEWNVKGYVSCSDYISLLCHISFYETDVYLQIDRLHLLPPTLNISVLPALLLSLSSNLSWKY